ncbi:hypothetical protein BDN70DRAFT_939732 [Pholiota conissans]|uniref:Uncharacterized protein n=1 Tax=Pholiota conissans TaxID=109636 RepID=A0A9P5YKS7_9AGAR|nr:hypothetical protein BDN70DRAFT_939732 [Pholiota conissans]
MNVEEVIQTNAPPDFRQSSASAVYKCIELANTVVSIVKVVGELLSTVPYIKSLSSVQLNLFIKEFNTNEKRCLKIIDKALRMAQALYEQLAEVARSSHREMLSSLILAMLTPWLELAALFASLQKHRSRSTRMAVRTFDSVRVRKISSRSNVNIARSIQVSGRPQSREAKSRKPLGSANDVVPQGAPKSSLSKLSNVSSTLVPSPLSTLKAWRIRTDSILELSSDANSMSTSSYIRTPLDENLPFNTNASSGSAETNGKRAQDLKIERDQALIYARDELEEVLKSIEAELNSKSKTLGALTSGSEELRSQIGITKGDLQKAASISKIVDEERDRALTCARKANDAHTTARSHIQALESELTVKSEAIDTLTTDFLRPTSAHKDSRLHGRELEDAQTTTPPKQKLQFHIDVLATDLLKSVAISKNLEEERNQAQLRTSELEIAQTIAMDRIQELEENLKSTGEELSSKIRDNDKLLAHSQRCRVAVADQCSIVLTREGVEQRASAQNHALDLEAQRDYAIGSAKDVNDALVKAQARIHALDDDLSSRSQTVSALRSNSSRLESQIDSLTSDLRDALSIRKDVEDERDRALSLRATWPMHIGSTGAKRSSRKSSPIHQSRYREVAPAHWEAGWCRKMVGAYGT